MDSIEASDALRQVRAHEQQTLDEARWPRWYVGAIAGLSFVMLALLDLESGAAYAGLCVVAISMLTERMARQASVRLHPACYSSRRFWWLAVASVAGLLVLYTLVRALLEPLDVAVPSTLAGLAVAAAIVAGAPGVQRALHSTIGRDER